MRTRCETEAPARTKGKGVLTLTFTTATTAGGGSTAAEAKNLPRVDPLSLKPLFRMERLDPARAIVRPRSELILTAAERSNFIERTTKTSTTTNGGTTRRATTMTTRPRLKLLLSVRLENFQPLRLENFQVSRLENIQSPRLETPRGSPPRGVTTIKVTKGGGAHSSETTSGSNREGDPVIEGSIVGLQSFTAQSISVQGYGKVLGGKIPHGNGQHISSKFSGGDFDALQGVVRKPFEGVSAQQICWSSSAPVAHELRDGYFTWRYQDQAATTTTINKTQPRHTDRPRGSRGKDNHRGGEKKRRSRNIDRGTIIIKIFFANITYDSAHAKAVIASREEDIVLLAETHQDAR